MGASLPKATTTFNQLTISGLASQAQLIINGLIAAATDYPTPPVIPADLQSLLNTFNTAAAAAVNRGALEINTRNAARLALENAIRADANYVNTVAWTMVQAGESYDAVSTSIVSTGFRLGLNPSPVGPLPQPTIKNFGSPNPGEFHIQLEKIFGAKVYAVWQILGPDTQVLVATWPNTRIRITGLPSGTTMTVAVVAVGSNTEAQNFSVPITQVIT